MSMVRAFSDVSTWRAVQRKQYPVVWSTVMLTRKRTALFLRLHLSFLCWLKYTHIVFVPHQIYSKSVTYYNDNRFSHSGPVFCSAFRMHCVGHSIHYFYVAIQMEGDLTWPRGGWILALWGGIVVSTPETTFDAVLHMSHFGGVPKWLDFWLALRSEHSPQCL